MAHLQKAGLRPIALVGGATGLIGDPSGRTEERPLLSAENVASNVRSLQTQLSQMLGPNVKYVNNIEWYQGMRALEFLRDVGKHFRVNAMMAKDSVKSRLADQSGISFTEFSYQILQAYDYYHLYKTENCKIQVGGNDQWGNITAGTDLIHRLAQKADAIGATVPLLTTSQGVKIGKSMGNAVWLSADQTTPYEFFQYFKRLADDDAAKMLRLLTFLPLEKIDELLAEHKKKPENWEAQKVLATEVTRFVHGQKGLDLAEAATKVFFGGEVDSRLTSQDVEAIFKEAGCIESVPRHQVLGQPVLQVANLAKLTDSNKELKRLIESKGLYVNNVVVSDKALVLTEQHLIGGKVLLFRTGKKNYKVVKLV